MKFQLLPANPLNPLTIGADCFVVLSGLSEKLPFHLFGSEKKIGKALSLPIAKIISEQEFEGKVGKTLVLNTHRDNKFSHALVVGVGDVNMLAMRDWLDVTATIGREANKIHANTVVIVLEEEILKKLGTKKTAEGIVEGMLLGTYDFNRYKNPKKKNHAIETVLIMSEEGGKQLEEGIRIGELMSRATILARDLVNEPSSITTPTFLSLVAKNIANDNPLVSCEILEKRDMEKLGMGGILGIAKGSDEDPKLIKLVYKGNGNKTIVLVGKGVTFDSGGLSLKSQEGMEMMKIDMAGAAAILGIFSVISQLKPDSTVIGVIPAVENMPSGKAVKPGDIVRAYNGKTIEIISTDAEGRVILADALSWAQKTFHPDAIIDVATLTGACMIALGEDIAGLFGTDGQLVSALQQSAQAEGEALWELPMPDSYNELLKSDIADIRNVTRKRYGGAITAALFLKAFVSEKTSWAHLDIAGPAIAEKDSPFLPVGGTGFGVRLLCEYLMRITSEGKRKIVQR